MSFVWVYVCVVPVNVSLSVCLWVVRTCSVTPFILHASDKGDNGDGPAPNQKTFANQKQPFSGEEEVVVEK